MVDWSYVGYALISDWDSRSTIAAVTALGSLAAATTGLWAYISNNRWKRREYVNSLFQKINANSDVKRAMQMLDWNVREIDLFPDEADAVDRLYRVTDELVAAALIPHNTPHRPKYTIELVRIRDIFDEFFTRISELRPLLQSSLVTSGELEQHLGYWFRLIAGTQTRHGTEFLRNIRLYIDTYFSGDVPFVMSYIAGCDIQLRDEKEKQELKRQLSSECLDGLWEKRILLNRDAALRRRIRRRQEIAGVKSLLAPSTKPD